MSTKDAGLRGGEAGGAGVDKVREGANAHVCIWQIDRCVNLAALTSDVSTRGHDDDERAATITRLRAI